MTGKLKQDLEYLKQLRSMYQGKKFKDVMAMEQQKLGHVRDCIQIINTTIPFMSKGATA